LGVETLTVERPVESDPFADPLGLLRDRGAGADRRERRRSPRE
jgi:hypothetical protein